VTHSLADRAATESVVARIVSEEGLEGYGEGAPREYVTGEKREKSLEALHELCREHLPRLQLNSPAQTLAALDRLKNNHIAHTSPAAFCAFESALLDLMGKKAGRNVAEMLALGSELRPSYSAVIPIIDEETTKHLLIRCRELKISSVKLKVKGEETIKRIAMARELLGPDADLRVDANGAWSFREARSMMKLLAGHGVSSVEQPTPKEDFTSLRELAMESEIPVVADESVCTLAELKELKALDFPFILNLRLSKCGGLLNLLEIYGEAVRSGITCQLGCQVGETGILSALGRQLAGSFPFLHLEGCFGNHLLTEDIVTENLTFGRKGWVAPLGKNGLGISVIKARLEKYACAEVPVV
jgi:muconate cycloisomerase